MVSLESSQKETGTLASWEHPAKKATNNAKHALNTARTSRSRHALGRWSSTLTHRIRQSPLPTMLAGSQIRFVRALSGADRARFRRLGAQAGAHHAQTEGWAKISAHQKRATCTFALVERGEELVASAVILRPGLGPIGGPVATIDRGPVAVGAEEAADAADRIARALRRRGVVRTHVMPYFDGDAARTTTRVLESRGFRSCQTLDGDHVLTLRLDVPEGAPDKTFDGGKRKSLRYQIRAAERAGAVVRAAGKAGIPVLARMHDALMEGQSKRGRPRRIYEALERFGFGAEPVCEIFVCEHEGETVSVGLFVRSPTRVTYVMGAASASPRGFSKTPALFPAVARWADEIGARIIDLGGIPAPSDPDEKRQSIARFKSLFSKEPIELVHEHARWL